MRAGRGHGVAAMPAEKAKDFSGTLKRLSRYLQPWRLQLISVFCAAVVSTAFSILSPKVVGQGITKLFEGSMLILQGVPGASVDFVAIRQILLLLAGLYILSALFTYIQQYVMAGVAQKTVYTLRKDVDAKLSRLPLKFYDTQTYGEILSRVTNDVDLISSTLQQSITQLITAVITIVGVIIMMLTISPLMTLITVLALPMGFLVTKPIISRSQKYFVQQQRALGQLNGHVEEMYSGHKIVKVFGREAVSIAEFEKHNDQLYNAGWRAQFISGMIMPLINFVNNIGYILVSVVGSVLVTRRAIAIGDIQAFIQYSRQFGQPIAQTANIANILQSTVAAAERVFELLDEPEEVSDCLEPAVLSFPRGQVQFQDVTFGYKEDTPVIKNLNINVSQGQTVAIVGPTGAGKTTLVNLLMRFYEVDSGKITIDGVNIRDLKRGDLRSLFGMVLQDTWLFNGTIRDNIAYSRPGATAEEVIQAAQAAHADHFIRTLPAGYDTVINEDASNLSQGQKQLLTIARAILADPAILILDEATSSVDTRTEVVVQKAMIQLMQGRTSFVIAHRLSTIRNADVILVMDKGSIIEKGTHTELLAANGFYAELYHSQFRGGRLESPAV